MYKKLLFIKLIIFTQYFFLIEKKIIAKYNYFIKNFDLFDIF